MFNRLTSTNNSNLDIKPPSAFFSNKINRNLGITMPIFLRNVLEIFFFSFLRRKIGKINGNGSSVNYITVNGHVKIFSVLERKPAPQMCMRRGDGTKLPESVMRFQEIHPSATSLSSILRAVSRSVYEENGRCRGNSDCHWNLDHNYGNIITYCW